MSDGVHSPGPRHAASRWPWALRGAVLGLGLLVLLWGLSVAGHAAPLWVSRTAVLLTAALTALSLGAGLRRRLYGSDSSASQRRLWLTLCGLLALALLIKVLGLSHEVGARYYADEGTYAHHVAAINGGEVLRPNFFYPHFLYYLDAFVVWMVSLFAGPLLKLSQATVGIGEWADLSRLVLRWVSALSGALTVLPVFFLALRLAGLAAAAVSACLIAFSVEYNQGSHIHTCDVPSAFFAAWCLALCGRLLERESWRDYLLAGLAAGLAAGSKYPAGLVAVAIIAVWLYWRLKERRWGWGLAGSGLVSLAVFVGTTPSFLLDPKQAIFGQYGMLLGLRQYSKGGWIGVVVESNLSYYLDLLERSFGWPVLIAGLIGLVLFFVRKVQVRESAEGSDRRALLLWLLPFPVSYVWLIAVMNVVAERNLYPALPPLAVLLGVGAATLVAVLRAPLHRRFAGGARWLAVALGLALLALPLVRVGLQDLALVRNSTRQQATSWLHEHLPEGSMVIKEGYTPYLDRERFVLQELRFAGVLTVPQLASSAADYLLLSNISYARFLDPDLHFADHHKAMEANYRSFFEGLSLVQEWAPSSTRLGPHIQLYSLPFAASELPLDLAAAYGKLLSGPIHGEQQKVRHLPGRKWLGFRAAVPAGRVRVRLQGEVPPGTVIKVADAEERELLFAELPEQDREPGQARDAAAAPSELAPVLELAAAQRLRFYVYVRKDVAFEGLRLELVAS